MKFVSPKILYFPLSLAVSGHPFLTKQYGYSLFWSYLLLPFLLFLANCFFHWHLILIIYFRDFDSWHWEKHWTRRSWTTTLHSLYGNEVRSVDSVYVIIVPILFIFSCTLFFLWPLHVLIYLTNEYLTLICKEIRCCYIIHQILNAAVLMLYIGSFRKVGK